MILVNKIAKNGEILETPLSISDLLAFHMQGASFFEDKWQKGIKNERAYLGRNWTEEQEAEITEQGRIPYSIPLKQSKLRTIEGLEAQSRTSWDVRASRNPENELHAELAVFGLKAIERRSDWEYVQTDVFKSGLSICYGATEIEVIEKNGKKSIKINSLDYRNCVWDYNSVKYNLSDALWTAKIEKLYRQDLIKDGFDVDDLASTTNDSGFEGREKDPYFISVNKQGRLQYDVISLITHYQVVYREHHVLLFPDSQNIFGDDIIRLDFLSPRKAKEELSRLNMIYALNGFEEEGEIVKETRKGIDKYVFTQNKIHKYEQLELEDSPIDVFRAVQFANDFIPFADFFDSPQTFYDRLISQIDYSFGTDTKNVRELDVTRLAEDETPQTAVDKLNKTGSVIYKKGGAPAVENVQASGMNPQWLQIADVMQREIDDIGGGRNFGGQAESGSQSGKAIMALQGQGLLVAQLLFDNLSRFKKTVGRKLLKMMNLYETAEEVIRINNDELSPEMIEILQNNGIYQPSAKNDGSGFVRINTEGTELTYLNDTDFELVIKQAPLTEIQKEYEYNKLIEAQRANPQLMRSSHFNKKLLENIPNISTKDSLIIIQELNAVQEAESNLARQKNERENEELNIKKAGAVTDAYKARSSNRQN